MSEIYKSYYAIIPANVRYDKELKDKAKLLYGEITALCNEKGYCWATNNYFANLYGVTKETISRLISNLANKDYVRVEIICEGKQIIERRIYITPEVIAQKSIPIDEKINTPPIDNSVNTPHDKIVNTPIDENVKDNNTNINNTLFNNLSINQEEACPQNELSITSDDEIDRLIKKNIGYNELKNTYSEIEDIYNLMLDVFVSSKKNMTINKDQIPIGNIRERFLSLNSMHIEYVLECVTKQPDIKNIRSYLLTALYNAPTTINSFYSNKVKNLLDNP